jgi:poly(3-hydroxybutyrate) depolymerase
LAAALLAAIVGAVTPIVVAGPAPKYAEFSQPGWREPVSIRLPADIDSLVREVPVQYVSQDGFRRRALVLMPLHVDSSKKLPLIIAPHGRGVTPEANSLFWGDLPGRDGFVLVEPAGMGRRLSLFSWGYGGQIEDLARMPGIVEAAFPSLNIDEKRIYAFGGSMGGQEALLLLVHHPDLLAGVAAFDAPTDMVKRYSALRRLKSGKYLQRLARQEIGGTPTQNPPAYRLRSPLLYARRIAFAGVPVQIWWSDRDHVVRRQWEQSGALVKAIREANPSAPLTEVKGMWVHTVEMEWDHRLPEALRRFGIVPLH